MSLPRIPAPKDAPSSQASELQWYAGLAMQAIIARQSSVPDTDSEREEIALWAIRMAQAMVATGRWLHVDDA